MFNSWTSKGCIRVYVSSAVVHTVPFPTWLFKEIRPLSLKIIRLQSFSKLQEFSAVDVNDRSAFWVPLIWVFLKFTQHEHQHLHHFLTEASSPKYSCESLVCEHFLSLIYCLTCRYLQIIYGTFCFCFLSHCNMINLLHWLFYIQLFGNILLNTVMFFIVTLVNPIVGL